MSFKDNIGMTEELQVQLVEVGMVKVTIPISESVEIAWVNEHGSVVYIHRVFIDRVDVKELQ